MFAQSGLSVNYNPANLMARGFDPFAGLTELGDAVAQVTVKDVVRTAGTVSGFAEAPVGRGELDFARLAAELACVDYRGWWVLASDAPVNDDRYWQGAVEFLKRL